MTVQRDTARAYEGCAEVLAGMRSLRDQIDTQRAMIEAGDVPDRQRFEAASGAMAAELAALRSAAVFERRSGVSTSHSLERLVDEISRSGAEWRGAGAPESPALEKKGIIRRTFGFLAWTVQGSLCLVSLVVLLAVLTAGMALLAIALSLRVSLARRDTGVAVAET